METLTITNEDELFSLLEKYVKTGEISDKINLEDLPPLKIRLVGEKFDQSLTPNVMKGFVEMQNYINRTYRLVKYGDVETKSLSKEEREALQLQVKVEKGSSIIDISFDGLWAQIGQLASKMNGTELALITLGSFAIWGTTTGVKRFLNNRKEVRLAEIKKDSDKEHLKTFEAMSAQETQRAEIMAQIIQSHPVLENVDRQAYDAKTSLFKSFASVDEVEVGDTTVDQELSSELTKTARRRSTEIRLDGTYRLEQVNTTDPTLFKVKIRNTKTNQVFEAIVQEQLLEGNKNKLMLMQAEWDRKPVKLSINAKVLDEKIRDATITSVDEIEVTTN
ncbi:hypothetical protein ACT2CV_01285 [Pasteurellaceae bacterium 22721_9_1]